MRPIGSEPGADFDRWLRGRLRVALDAELRPPPVEARYAAASRQRGGRVIPIRFGITAALGAKAVIGGAVVALAAGAAGAAATGSMSPATWGQHVREAVEQCRAADVNVGRCVSAIAREHGPQVRGQHSEAVENATASPSPMPGQREGQVNGQSHAGGSGASSNGQGQGQDKGQSQSQSQSHDDHGHGRPSPHS